MKNTEMRGEAIYNYEKSIKCLIVAIIFIMSLIAILYPLISIIILLDLIILLLIR